MGFHVSGFSLGIAGLHQPDTVHPHQVKLHFLLPFLCMLPPLRIAISMLMQASGCFKSVALLQRRGRKKKSHSIPVLCPLSGRLAIVLLDPCAAQMESERGKLAGGRSVNGIYISARTCGEQKIVLLFMKIVLLVLSIQIPSRSFFFSLHKK